MANNLQDLKKELKGKIEAERQKSTRKKIAYGVMTVFVVGYLSFIYSTATGFLNMDTLLGYAHVKGHENIATMNTKLKEAAPKVVSDIFIGRLNKFPEKFYSGVMEKMEPMIADTSKVVKMELEKELMALAERSATTKAKLSRVDIQKTYDKVFKTAEEKIMRGVINLYRENSVVMNELTTELNRLGSGQDLNENDRLKRKALGSWLAILDHKGVSW